MLICFGDESGNQDVFTMACAMSDEKRWLKLDRERSHALAEFRVPFSHMKKLVARKSPYIGRSRQKQDAFIRRLVWIFQSHVMAWCATTVVVEDYYAVVKTDKHHKKRNPYFHAFQVCIGAALVFCGQDERITEKKVSFMLDSGGASKQRAAEYFAAFKGIKGQPQDQLGVLPFGDDEKNNALQAADLLAYEVHKHNQGFKRKSFAALRELPHATNLWDARNLKEVLKSAGVIHDTI